MKKINKYMLTELSNNELLNINGGVKGGSLLSGSIWAAGATAAANIECGIGFIKGWIAAWME